MWRNKNTQNQIAYIKKILVPARWGMLKQWMLADGKTDGITVEEKFVKWCEQLRTDRYGTVPCMQLKVLNKTFESYMHVIPLIVGPGNKAAAVQDLRTQQGCKAICGIHLQGKLLRTALTIELSKDRLAWPTHSARKINRPECIRS